MLGPTPRISASWALAGRLPKAAFPPQHYAQFLRDNGRQNSGSSPGTDQKLRSLIADAMWQLPFEHRAVIERAYYQGWTIARIAADLKMTEATVKSRLHDGLHALRLTFPRIKRQGEAQ
jgi:DNA-directed RNA polymerase specialized sigma24 family protein